MKLCAGRGKKGNSVFRWIPLHGSLYAPRAIPCKGCRAMSSTYHEHTNIVIVIYVPLYTYEGFTGASLSCDDHLFVSLVHAHEP
jgi:hypothetical protein